MISLLYYVIHYIIIKLYCTYLRSYTIILYYYCLYYTNTIGNKCDKPPAFDLSRCEEYAKSINAFYFQTRYYALYIILYYTMTYCDIPQGIMLYYTILAVDVTYSYILYCVIYYMLIRIILCILIITCILCIIVLKRFTYMHVYITSYILQHIIHTIYMPMRIPVQGRA